MSRPSGRVGRLALVPERDPIDDGPRDLRDDLRLDPLEFDVVKHLVRASRSGAPSELTKARAYLAELAAQRDIDNRLASLVNTLGIKDEVILEALSLTVFRQYEAAARVLDGE